MIGDKDLTIDALVREQGFLQTKLAECAARAMALEAEVKRPRRRCVR
jgi:hypothetical protein